MAIIEKLGLYQFRRAFETMRPDSFSYEAQEVLFDYLEQLSEDIGKDIELDVIGLCGEYSEELLKDVLENYNLKSLEDLENYTTVLSCDLEDYDEEEAMDKAKVLYECY
jgi:hypothetical protein